MTRPSSKGEQTERVCDCEQGYCAQLEEPTMTDRCRDESCEHEWGAWTDAQQSQEYRACLKCGSIEWD